MATKKFFMKKFARVEPKHATVRFVIAYHCAKHKFLFIVRVVEKGRKILDKKRKKRERLALSIHLYIQCIRNCCCCCCWTGYFLLLGGKKREADLIRKLKRNRIQSSI